MELKPHVKIGEDKEAAKLPIGVLYDAEGRINRIKYIDFRPGAIIRRCGRAYEVLPNGTQRRITLPEAEK